MLKLIEGNTYLIQYQKKDGSIRPILCTIESIPLGSSCFFVKEGDNPKTLLHSGVLSYVKAKAKTQQEMPLMLAETQLISHGNIEDKKTHIEQKQCVKQRYNVKKINGKYIIFLLDNIVGTAYSVGQVERIIEIHMKYKF